MAEQILKIKLENVRLSRVSLAKPYPGKPDPATGKLPDPKYHIDAIIEPNHPQLPKLQELMRTAIVQLFGDQATVVQQQIVANNKLPLHRGDVDRAGKPEYAGKLFISANNKEQPTIVVYENGVAISNRNTPEVLTPAHAKYPYSGCYADVHLTISAYGPPFAPTRGVRANVDGVMYRSKGERLRAASVSALSEFAPPPEDADGDAPPPAATGGSGLL